MRLISIPPSAIKKHLDAYYDTIKYALGELCAGNTIRIGQRVYSATTDQLKNYCKILQENFTDRDNCILVAPPDKLRLFLRKERRCWNNITERNERKSCVDTLKALFSYDRFSRNDALRILSDGKVSRCSAKDWGATAYLDALKVKFCPYCNAETIYAIKFSKDKKTIRSALDHYYSQKYYPCLSLSLYNLVPACTRCNTSLKRDEVFVPPEDYANPYEDDIHEHTRFSYLLTGKKENLFDTEQSLELILRETAAKSPRVDKLMDFFRVKDVYNALFRFEAINTLEIKRRLVSGYGSELRALMPELTDEQFYHLVYGCCLNPDKINQERLSKMKIDLVERGP